MNKNLMSLALCGLMASSLSAIDFRGGFRAAGNAAADNAAPLALIGLAIANYNAKNTIKSKLPGADTKGVLSMGEPALALILALGIHQKMQGDTPIKKSFTKLKGLGRNGDTIDIILNDGSKVLGTLGLAYTVGKYAHTSFKGWRSARAA